MEPLEYIGVDPSTGDGDSPTIWVDHENDEIVMQGLKPSDELMQRVHDRPAPRHAPGTPEHENVTRIPFRMAAILRKACDVAEGLD